MNNLSKKNISDGAILVISLMVVNIINFIFNAFLGRVLTFEEFGLITVINTFLYIVTIAFNALYATTNHKVAYLTGKNEEQKAQIFFQVTVKKTILISLILSVLWIIAIPATDSFFKINNPLVALFFTPIITFGVITAIDKGFLQGKFHFHYVAVIITAEVLSKLFFAWIFVHTKLNYWVYLSIPLSSLMAFLFASMYISSLVIKIKSIENYSFPKKFFNASLLTGLASIAFLTLDVLLVKHFLSPAKAGQYALLSLVGKMVFFFGSLPSALIITFINNDEGHNRDTRKSFYQLFFATVIFSAVAFIALGLLGNIFIPVLFGSKARAIMPYITTYSAAIMCYAIASVIVIYHLAKRQYIFPETSAAMAIIMSIGIILFHKNIGQITWVIFAASVLTLAALSTLHIFEAHIGITQTKKWFNARYE